MEQVFLWAGVVMLCLMVFPLYRVAKGPTGIDRIVAINMIGTKTTVLLVLIGVIFGPDNRVDMFVDFALAYSLLNFIGSIAAARYLFRTRPESTSTEGLV